MSATSPSQPTQIDGEGGTECPLCLPVAWPLVQGRGDMHTVGDRPDSRRAKSLKKGIGVGVAYTFVNLIKYVLEFHLWVTITTSWSGGPHPPGVMGSGNPENLELPNSFLPLID